MSAEPNSAPEVLYDVADRVATLTINRPEKRNTLSPGVNRGLRDGLNRAKADPEVRCVVITGAGDRAFCAGADLMGVHNDSSFIERHEARGEFVGIFGQLYSLGKPTVAKVRGFALAGGFGLALACDMIVCSDDAVFGTPEINVGMWPMMITVPMLRSMPPKIALELQMTGRRVPADEALRHGFVNRVVPADQLDADVHELTANLALKSPSIMKLGRDAFYTVIDLDAANTFKMLQTGLTLVNATEDSVEGIRAYAEKRPPNYLGR